VKVALPFVAWATILTVLAAVLWVWSSDHFPPVIFTAAAGVAWCVGLYALFHPFPRALRRAPDLSLASGLVALAIAMLLLSALVGEWLLLIGGGTLVAGLVWLARELRAERRVR
jgi:uncharacterized MnhB-related membrane protein